MRRIAFALLGPACGLSLLLACFHAVLFGGEQFAYRDAAHFYYPLYLRVQQEWDAGRWPLWDPWQNGGAPLLGLPMAAVLYPGKALYAHLPYPWAARLYVVAHVACAFAGMFALARTWGRSATAAGLAALAYAFGAPVLFQYSNVIFLVGAAWLPWGFAAIDLLLRQGRRAGLPALAAVLAMQVLGGDPEAAYLTVLCGAAYTLVLVARATDRPGRLVVGPRRPWVVIVFVPTAILLWFVAVIVAGYAWPRVDRPAWLPPRKAVLGLIWGGIGLAILRGWRRRPREARLAPMLAGLAGASALALVLTAVQLLPTLEFARMSRRAADDPATDLFFFSVDPYRLVEAVWPGVFGTCAAENRSILQALPPIGNHALWTPSLYLGGLTVALAAGTLGMRGGPPWRTWLLAVLLVGLAASFGRYAGPLWWARWLRVVPATLGPHDPLGFEPRDDAFLEDGAGSPYAIMATVLPGFALFRYPAKLMTFVAMATAGLAAMGWDLLVDGRTRRPARWCAFGLAATLLVAALATAARPWMVRVLSDRLVPDAAYGPIDLPAALDAMRLALLHGGVVFATGLGLATLATRRPRWSGALALVVMTLDLGVANARLVWTAPQAVFDAPSRAARLIEAAEAANPSRSTSTDPYRIHRMPLWHPEDFTGHGSPGRLAELARWERDTLQPSNGLPLGFEYTLTQGVLELIDYLMFFRHQQVPASPEAARFLAIAPGREIAFYPRRGFDLWNTRYFILPIRTDGWRSRDRGYAAFLPDTEPIAPDPKMVAGPEGDLWRDHEDWQILRNKNAYPRAWLVHFVRVRKPIVAMSFTPEAGDEGLGLMRDLVYGDDPFWDEPGRRAYDLRAMAFVETDRPEGLAGYVARVPVTDRESVVVTRYEPQRVEILATLESPGLVVLADVFYPGWNLTIDGVPATIYRTNRLMRGAAVKAGRHTLVYLYKPTSFRIGAALSVAGLLGMVALVPWAARGR